jgi:branched-chain amino acid transport system ATP-binding protein
MLDEPSLGLAPYLVLLLFDVIRRLRNEGVTMVLVEQNTHLSLAISDYAYVLSNGRIEIEGEAREVMKIDSVKKAYLGM